MKLFYNPTWIPAEHEMMLFLVKANNPDQIKTWDDLQPKLNREIADLIVIEDQHQRPNSRPFSLTMVENLLHKDLTMEIENDFNPIHLANLILEYLAYQNEIKKLRQRIKANQMNPKRMPPDLLGEVYNERSLGAILELL